MTRYKPGSGSRVVVYDEFRGDFRTKTDSEIVRENEEFLKLLRGESQVSIKDDELKRAAREGNYAAVIQERKLSASDPLLTSTVTNIVKENDGAEMKITNSKKHVSLRLGVVGSGQAGGRMAEVFYKFGYDACAINTARQDLEFLDFPESKKLCVEYTLSGSGKDIEIGQAAIEENRDSVEKFVSENIGDSDVAVLTISLGGGSGSGSAVPLVEILASLGKPVLVICALPGSFDDSQSKFNTVQTLGRLADMSAKGTINSLVVLDNAKLERVNPNLSQAAFWEVSNRSVIEPLHMFNSVTAMPTNFETLDAMDLTRAFLESGNCALFGSCKISKDEYEGDEAALLTALVSKLQDSLPADDFDLKEAQAIGVLVTAKQEVLDSVPYQNIAYVFKYISEEFDSSRSFKGVYPIASEDDDITISFIFSGMGLPKPRVEGLKEEADKHTAKLESKKKHTAASMSLGQKDKQLSQADKILAKVKQKQSAVGKLLSNKNDRRR